ncbi:RNA polymerase sigma factor [Streptomyces ipomoeae]|uniref:RNA polymerase sigma factor n=1 Tax=Streptomyces ipomoeae TaxID=103232 RepID=UPI0015F1221B|nr:sigma-70 family RNA polymerase sigma factor [Streptomyces ipomoeae]MDX2931253.1 sigma-70 family RNA polymerase sigma factor [Streptomyces ipomoeae]
MDDRTMVAAIRAADPRGLAAAYDAYAGQIYGYCCSVLHNSDAAADALQDTFVLASKRIDQLRDPQRLRPWLYAIARNECRHQLRAKGRTTPLEETDELVDEAVDLGAGLRAEEIRALVWEAFEGLNSRDREVLELSVRQDLDGADVAAALGIPRNHAHALLSRARQQFENAVTAVILARDGRRDCPDLRRMLDGWDGTMTVLMRKRITRHIGQCDICDHPKRRDVRPSDVTHAVPGAPPPPGTPGTPGTPRSGA